MEVVKSPEGRPKEKTLSISYKSYKILQILGYPCEKEEFLRIRKNQGDKKRL